MAKNHTRIAEAHIDITAVQEAYKTKEELQASGMFSHLPKDEQAEAYSKVWDKANPAPVKVPAPAKGDK
jgi:hypothetical protein